MSASGPKNPRFEGRFDPHDLPGATLIWDHHPQLLVFSVQTGVMFGLFWVEVCRGMYLLNFLDLEKYVNNLGFDFYAVV